MTAVTVIAPESSVTVTLFVVAPTSLPVSNWIIVGVANDRQNFFATFLLTWIDWRRQMRACPLVRHRRQESRPELLRSVQRIFLQCHCNVVQTEVGHKPKCGVFYFRSVPRLDSDLCYCIHRTHVVQRLVWLLPWCKALCLVCRQQKALFGEIK